MAYPILNYFQCNDVHELLQRFKNLQPLVHVYSHQYHLVNTALTNPEEGQRLLQEILAKLQDLKEDQENIATAIAMLNASAEGFNDEDFDEEEE